MMNLRLVSRFASALIISAVTITLLGLVSGSVHIARAAGNTWTVNDLGDSGTATCSANAGSGGPICQLRDAINRAANADTIAFANTLNGIIKLDTTRGTLIVASSITLAGPGALRLAIDGNRVGGSTFSVLTVSSGVTATISDLTIQNGYSTNPVDGGGGIDNAGVLTVNRCQLLNNTYAYTPQTFPGPGGGGIYNTGTLIINSSTIANNSSARDGGGIFNYSGGITTISNSTITGNKAIYGAGGGVYNLAGGMVTISNSTISTNLVDGPGGGVLDSGTLFLLSTLIAQNANYVGHFYNDLDLAGSGGVATSLGYNLISVAASYGFSPTPTDKVGTSANPIDPLLIALGEAGGSTQTMALPVYGPAYQAGDCSGNNTVTPPAPPVIHDQRGQNRKTPCDIGAFEETFNFNPNPLPNGVPGAAYSQPINATGGTGPYSYRVAVPGTGLPPGIALSTGGVLSGVPTGNRVSTFTAVAADSSGVIGTFFYSYTVSGPTGVWTVNVNTDSGLNTCQRNGGMNGPQCELRDALTEAGNGDTVIFANGLSSPILLNTALGTLNVGYNLTINGPGASNLAIDGNKASGATFPIITVDQGVTATISGLTIQNGHNSDNLTNGGGGGIYNNGTLTITNSVFNNNIGDTSGGAICNNGVLTVQNSTFTGNVSYNAGGAIANNDFTTITNSIFSSNSSSYLGGAIFSSAFQTLTINNSVISGNVTSDSGGGIDVFGGVAVVNDSTFSGNEVIQVAGGAAKSGDDTANRAAKMPISKRAIANTAAAGFAHGGGGISNRGAKMTISNSTIANNTVTAGAQGGGIQNFGKLTISNSTIAGNSANDGGSGGGIYNDYYGTLNLVGSVVARNAITGTGSGIGPDIINSNGTVNSFGHNLVGDGTASGLIATAGDQIGTSLSPIDPLLNPLANNGGLTPTMSLQAGSPAIDQGDCTGNTSANPPAPAVATDQRWINRKTPCDMGAFESASVPHMDTIGVFRNGTSYLRLHNSTGYADINVAFNPATKPYPVVGDWTDAGFDSVGVFDQSTGLFSLCTTNDSTACSLSTNQITFIFGAANDIPLSGHWQIGVPQAGVGLFRPSNGLIYLKKALSTGFADDTMVLGIPGDVGLAGDWTGKGFDSPGVYRPSNSIFYLSNQVCNCSVYSDTTFVYGVAGDSPVIGDWIGQGHDGVGLFRQSNGYTYLRNELTTGYADITFTYGIANDVPVAGHWQLVYPPQPNPENVLVPPTAAPVPAGGSLGDGLSD